MTAQEEMIRKLAKCLCFATHESTKGWECYEAAATEALRQMKCSCKQGAEIGMDFMKDSYSSGASERWFQLSLAPPDWSPE